MFGMFGPFSNSIASSCWNPRFLPELPFCWLLSWPTVMCLRGSNGSTTICSVPLISALQQVVRVEGVQVQVSLSFGKTQINIAILILYLIFTCKRDSHLLRLQNPEKVWRVIKKIRENWTHLPSCETGRAEKVTTRLDPDVFAVLGADFAQLQQENNSNPDFEAFHGIELHYTSDL